MRVTVLKTLAPVVLILMLVNVPFSFAGEFTPFRQQNTSAHLLVSLNHAPSSAVSRPVTDGRVREAWACQSRDGQQVCRCQGACSVHDTYCSCE